MFTRGIDIRDIACDGWGLTAVKSGGRQPFIINCSV